MSLPSVTVCIGDPDELLAVLEVGAAAADDEAVDLLAHSLQCAAILERLAPDDPELQVAGLVHDVGTILVGRPEHHAAAGAAAVQTLLGSRVARLVDHHDVAKRYLVTTDPGYRHRLSPRSLATLRLQGGLLAPDERAAFAAGPDVDACLLLRRADDTAKVRGAAPRSLTYWRPVIERLACRAA